MLDLKAELLLHVRPEGSTKLLGILDFEVAALER